MSVMKCQQKKYIIDYMTRLLAMVLYTINFEIIQEENYTYATNIFVFGDDGGYQSYMGSIYKMYYPIYDMIEERDTVFYENSCQTTNTKYHNSDQRVQLTYPYLHQTDVRLTDSITYKQNKFYKKIVNDYVAQSVGTKDTLYGRMFILSHFLFQNLEIIYGKIL